MPKSSMNTLYYYCYVSALVLLGFQTLIVVHSFDRSGCDILHISAALTTSFSLGP